MSKKFKDEYIPSIQIFQSFDDAQKQFNMGQYDDQPTIMYASNKGQSFRNNMMSNVANYRLKQQAKQKANTFQQDLMQTSQQKSQQQKVDNEFVFKYLTPIKKQQFQDILFKDQIEQFVSHKTHVFGVNRKNDNQRQQVIKRTQLYKPNYNKIAYKPQANSQQNNFVFQNSQNQNSQNNNKYECVMINSFIPNIPQKLQKIIPHRKTSKNQVRNQSSSKNYQQLIINQQKSIQNHQNGIFVDPLNQIKFLKQNNKILYQKLTQEMQKNKRFQQKIQLLSEQNRKMLEQNQLKTQKIKSLIKVIKKLQQQQKLLIGKQWEQFQFLKQNLINLSKNKSKTKLKQNSLKVIPILTGNQQKLSENKQQFIEQRKNTPNSIQSRPNNTNSMKNVSTPNRKSAQNNYFQRKVSLNTEQSHNNNKSLTHKKRKLSVCDLSQTKRNFTPIDRNSQSFNKKNLKKNQQHQNNQNRNKQNKNNIQQLIKDKLIKINQNIQNENKLKKFINFEKTSAFDYGRSNHKMLCKIKEKQKF